MKWPFERSDFEILHIEDCSRKTMPIRYISSNSNLSPTLFDKPPVAKPIILLRTTKPKPNPRFKSQLVWKGCMNLLFTISNAQRRLVGAFCSVIKGVLLLVQIDTKSLHSQIQISLNTSTFKKAKIKYAKKEVDAIK